jgi:outer membrane protein TolC
VATSAPPPSHPRLALAERRVAAARAQLELVSRLRRDNPTAAVVVRNDRDTYGADYRNSVRLGVSLPLDTEARNAPRIAQASEALLETQARLDEEARRLAYETEVARAETATMSGQVEFARQRVAAASDALALVERAHALGERALAEVLRMGAVVRGAEAALRSATIGRDAARSALNQSLGLMP